MLMARKPNLLAHWSAELEPLESKATSMSRLIFQTFRVTYRILFLVWLLIWPATHLLLSATGFGEVSAKPRLMESEDVITVANGTWEVQWVRAGNGTPSMIRSDERRFDLDDTFSPIYAEVWETSDSAPFSDRLDGTALQASATVVDWKTEQTDGTVTVRALGAMVWPSESMEDRLEWMVAWQFEEGRPGMEVSWDLHISGEWQDRVVRELSWQLPLGLEHRKRVAQGGEQGVHWDTRYYYNFIIGPDNRLMPHPEVNIWRHFAVEQESPETFRTWRAEGSTTAPLIMERGESAAGWVGIYDQQGGFFAASRELAVRAPSAMRVDAKGAGLLRMQAVPPTTPAISPHSPDFDRQVLGSHLFHMIPFQGEWDLDKKSATLRDLWEVDRLGSDPVDERTAPVEEWLRTEGDPSRPVFPVTGGVPLPRGQAHPDMGFRIFHDQQELPVQWQPLAYWPDGSVKWALLIFPLDPDALRAPGRGEEHSFDVEVTLRDGSSLPVQVHYGAEVEPATVHNEVMATGNDAEIRLENHSLRMVLQPGTHWLRDLQRSGRQLIEPSGQPSAFVDYLDLSEPYRPLDAHAQGERLPGPLEVTDMRLEEAGPIRSVVRLSGHTVGEEPVKVIIRIETYAGSEWARIWKTVEFLDADPRQRMVSAMGLSLPLRLNSDELRLFTESGDDGHGQLAQGSQFQFSPRGYRWATTDDNGTTKTTATGNRAQGWMSMSDRQDGVSVIQRYFWEQAPRENRGERTPHPRLTAYFWSDAAPVMDVRRYSDFPHRSQGESVPNDYNYWVYGRDGDDRRNYYESDPFKGISKTFETLWGFHEPDIDPVEMQSIAADFHSRPLIYAGEKSYRSLGIALPWGDPNEFPDITRNYDNMIDFWLFNQRFWNWYSPWQHGDTAYGFHSGYGYLVPAEELRKLMALPEDQRFQTTAVNRIRDYYPNNDWTFDNGRWGWSMTEKLQGQFWQMQYLRTGRRDVFFQAEAYAANARDVVIRHHGRWFGRGTRHGVQHWSCGNHEERQTVHLEWRFHHYLTGDARSADVSDRLTEEYYLANVIRGIASPSGRLPGLLMHWERTGDERTRSALESYLRAMIVPRGIQFPAVDMRTGEKVDDGPVNNERMFFHTFGAMHAVLEYWYLTDDENLKADLKQGLLGMAHHFVDTNTLYAGGKVIGFGAKHSGEPGKFLTALDNYLEANNRWRNIFQTVTSNPDHWSGPTSILQGAATGSWSRINKVPYWTSVWDELGVPKKPNERQRAEMEEKEQYGEPREIPRLQWQDAYDAPEFDHYFNRWRPWSETYDHPASQVPLSGF